MVINFYKVTDWLHFIYFTTNSIKKFLSQFSAFLFSNNKALIEKLGNPKIAIKLEACCCNTAVHCFSLFFECNKLLLFRREKHFTIVRFPLCVCQNKPFLEVLQLIFLWRNKDKLSVLNLGCA